MAEKDGARVVSHKLLHVPVSVKEKRQHLLGVPGVELYERWE